MIIPWQIPTMAIANRMRDGWITELTANSTNPVLKTVYNFFTNNSQMGRLICYAIPLGLTIYFTNEPHWIWFYNLSYLIALIAASFIGVCVAQLGKYDTIPTAWHPDMLVLMGGLPFVGFTALITAVYSYVLAVYLGLSSLTISIAYLVGWSLPGKWHGTLWGSFIFGAFIGLSIFLSTLL